LGNIILFKPVAGIYSYMFTSS